MDGPLSGPALDTACRTVLELPPQPAIAQPAWWDAGAPAQRVTYARRASAPLPASPWPPRQALDFCAELALALAPVHEAGACHGALRPEAVEMRPDGGPLVRLPGGDAGPGDDLRGLGVLLLHLLTGRRESMGLLVSGEAGPAAAAADLLQSLLAEDPAERPDSARAVAARLAEIAPSVAPPLPPRAPRRRARLATALVLLAVAGVSGAYFVTQRVGPPGPTLSTGTVSVPVPPAVTP
jgi:hypothetical protein